MWCPNARVVELVDTRDLKSLDHCDRAGSSPAPGTTFISEAALRRHSQVAKARACKALIPGSNPGVASILFILLHNYREMAERLNALVLKTSEGHTSGSSNLPLPATTLKNHKFKKHSQLQRGSSNEKSSVKRSESCLLSDNIPVNFSHALRFS